MEKEMKSMTEKEFLENALKEGWAKDEILSFIAEEKQEIAESQELGEIHLPLESSLAFAFNSIFKGGPQTAENYPMMPPVEELA